MKKIEFNYKNKDYCLEFTRKIVETMERRGFVASDIRTKPMLTLPALFSGAFLANHKNVKQAVIDEIFDLMTNKDELISTLAEMYNEPIEAYFDEPEEDEGNIDWTSSK